MTMLLENSYEPPANGEFYCVQCNCRYDVPMLTPRISLSIKCECGNTLTIEQDGIRPLAEAAK